MAVTIEDIVRVSIVGMSTPINLSADLFWKGPGETKPTYVKLVKAKSEINRLLGQPLLAKGKDKRKLQFTSIIETLTQTRNDEINSIIAAAKATENKIDLDIDGPKPVGRRKKSHRRLFKSFVLLSVRFSLMQ